MSAKLVCLSSAALALWLGPALAYAQRGVGAPQGVAQLPVRPEVVALTGTLEAMHIGPCEHTTGHGLIGAHVIVATDDDRELNIHLGPAGAVEFALAQLKVGQSVAVDAFRTDAMPTDQFIAVKVKVDKSTLVLRDESLRPVWAGRQDGAGYGYRPGAGLCPRGGWGRGGGRGFGYGRGFRGPYGPANGTEIPSADAALDRGPRYDGPGRGGRSGFGYGYGYRQRGGW